MSKDTNPNPDALVTLRITATLATGATVEATLTRDVTGSLAVVGLDGALASRAEELAGRGLVDELGQRIADVDGWHECACGEALPVGALECEACASAECEQCGAAVADEGAVLCVSCASVSECDAIDEHVRAVAALLPFAVDADMGGTFVLQIDLGARGGDDDPHDRAGIDPTGDDGQVPAWWVEVGETVETSRFTVASEPASIAAWIVERATALGSAATTARA